MRQVHSEPAEVNIASCPYCVVVMSALMELNIEYWTDILSDNISEIGSTYNDIMGTPEVCAAPRAAELQKSTAKVKAFFGESPRYELVGCGGVHNKEFINVSHDRLQQQVFLLI